MHKLKLGEFFKTWRFLISDCNLAGFPMLKILTAKISGFSHIEILLKLPSKQFFSVILLFLNFILDPFFRVKTDQEVGRVSRSLFVSIYPSEEHFCLLFLIFNLSFFLLQSKNEIYDLIVENLILLFFFAWSCCTVCFRFIN